MLLTRPNTLSDQQCRELEELKTTTKQINVYRRAKVILYRNAGYLPDEIEEHTEYSEREQRYLIRRYREEGVKGVYDRPRSGRPKQGGVRASGAGDSHEGSAPNAGAAGAQGVNSPPNAAPDGGHGPKPDGGHAEDTSGSMLSSWARMTLEMMHASHPKRYLRERAQMLLLRDKGYSLDEIADILDVQVETVRQVWARYDRDKLAGLYRKSGSGRRSTLGREQWEQFAKWVKKGPKALGYRFIKWTTRSLRKYIFKRFNIRFSREWIRQKLHHFLNYSWTRGKKVYAYADNEDRNADRQRFSGKMLDYLERARNGQIVLLFEDESLVTLFGEVGYSWSPTGHTQEVPSAGKHGRVVVFGAADPVMGRAHYRLEDDSINQASTLRFITQLVRYYQKHAAGIPLVIVLDKHPGHTASSVADIVKAHPHVTLEKTPTQSPDLNPIERIWDWLAELMIKNDFFETTDALKHAVRHFFCYIAGIKERVVSCLGNLQKLYTAEAGMEIKI